jgi:hypothetical protein
MPYFDVSLKENLPAQEIKAKNADEAKKIYLEAVKRALDIDNIDALELEIIK